MNVIIKRIIPIIIAFAQWLITMLLHVDRLFFSYNHETKYSMIIKVLFLFLLIVIWCFIFEVVRRVKSCDKIWKRGLFIFTVYFVIMMVLLLIMWPGTWSWDDVYTLDIISDYTSFNAWQHVLSGMTQGVMLQLIPTPGGIIIVQNAIIALCVAFTITKLEAAFSIGKFKNIVLDTFLKFIPFILPPVLFYQFSGYRMGLYIYFELVMLIMLIAGWKDKKQWNIRYVVLFALLAVIVAAWRTESIVYIPFICILLIATKKAIIPNKKKILGIAIIVLGFLCIYKFQSLEQGNANYTLISIMRPCAHVVREASETEDADDLAAIDKVADVEIIKNNPEIEGDELYWHTDCIKNRNKDKSDDFTAEDYDAFLKAFISLSMKYPKTVLSERFNVFVDGSGITNESYTHEVMAAELFDEGNESAAFAQIADKSWAGNQPINKDLRKAFIYGLGGRTAEGEDVGWIKVIAWNAIIPEIILILAWIKLLVRKRWYLFFVLTAVVIRIPIVFLTEPGHLFMYVLSFYLLGYTFLVYHILNRVSSRKNKEELEVDG